MSFKEIEALKSLKHDNIVEFVKEDREVSSFWFAVYQPTHYFNPDPIVFCHL